MNLSKDQISKLVHLLAVTRDQESNCEECLKDLAEFVETQLEGKSIPESLDAVENHLEICDECREEFQTLLSVLRGDA